MLTIQRTSTRLTLTLVPWFVWLLGLGIVGAGIGIGFFATSKTIFACDRTPPAYCTFTQSSFLKTNQELFAIHRLQKATVQRYSRSSGSRRRSTGSRWRYEVRIRVAGSTPSAPSEQSLNWTVYSSSDESNANSLADRINTFIQDPNQAPIQITKDSGFPIFLVFVILVGTGSVLLLSNVVIWELDQQQQQWTITEYGLRGKKVSRYSLADIAGAQLQVSGDSGSSQSSPSKKTQSLYGITMVLQSGKSIPMTAYYAIGGKQAKQKAVEHIQAFLNRPQSLPREQHDNHSVPQETAKNAIKAFMGGKEHRQKTIIECQAKILQNPYHAESYRTLAIAWITQGDRTQAMQILKTGRARLMRHGDVEQAQTLDRLLQSYGLEKE